MLRALKYAQMFNVVIAQHCQDDKIAGKGVMNSGYYSTILGLPGLDPLAEEAMLWRDIQLVKKIKAGNGSLSRTAHLDRRLSRTDPGRQKTRPARNLRGNASSFAADRKMLRRI